MSDTDKPGIKVVFTGLDNAGKSSIIATLMKDISMIPALKPTRGIRNRDFKFLGMQIAEWDLGGQKVYRRAYLNKDPEKIFGKTEILLSVVDIQDKNRIDEALEYLEDIYNICMSLKIKPSIYVFFHKYDPVSVMGSQAELNNFTLELREKIKSMLNYPQLEVFRTSIFNLNSILIAVSKMLLSKVPKSKAIEETIQEYSVKLNMNALELIDDNSLILGSYYRNKRIEQLMNAVSPFFLEVNEVFAKVSYSTPHEDKHDDQMVIQKFGKFFLFKRFTVKKIESDFYFLGCK
ncbi:MAG: hypothetical protein GY870_02285, partial [archaeon]|nr:hypothetical protein [archaeon]